MLLERLVVKNYGVYAGVSKFDLTSTLEKPIILVGGLNGAGKTTLFESIMVALYGKTYLGRQSTRKEYSTYIAKKIHTHNGVHADSASVEVAFRFYHNGNDDRYTVSRSWSKEGASVSESLAIMKNDSPLNDVDESQWQSFIEGLIPLGIARLFFFDGEKIVSMMDWGNPKNDEIRLSIDTLLGAELVNRLDLDLKLFLVRKSGKRDGVIEKQYGMLEEEKNLLASEISGLAAEYEKKKTEKIELEARVAVLEGKIANVGGGYADIRGELLARKSMLEERIRDQRRTIHEGLDGDTPFHLIPELLAKTKERIESDMSINSKRMAALEVRQKVEKLKGDMASGRFWGRDATHVKMEKILARLDDLSEEPEGTVFFDIAPNDAVRLLQGISKVDEGCGPLRALIRRYSGDVKLLERTMSDLAKIPRDDEIGPRISEINSIHQEIGMVRSEMEHMSQQISSKTAYQKILQNKLRRMIDSIHRDQGSDKSIRLAAKMRDVLGTYSKNLKERKMSELESNLLDALCSLLHKKHIHRVEIDRETFDLRIYENGNDDAPGTLKSMGERQMVGTALLWAIAKTSRRLLPFVIDTPVGRLDGKHFSNLVDKFYPFASHQLILLSTDREIGPKEHARLSKHVTRSYRITCNERKSATTVSAGYFGGKIVSTG